MKTTVKTVNEQGMKEIKQFLTNNHKKGPRFTKQSRLMAWKHEAEISYAAGNNAKIEIKWYDSINRSAKTYTVSAAGLDSP